MKKILVSVLSLVLFTSCADDTLPKYYDLGGFRILGIHVNTPDVNETSLPSVVTLTPILSDLDSGGRAITVTVVSCIDPGVSFGAKPSCDGVSGATSPTQYNAVIGAQGPGSSIFGSPSYTGTLDVGGAITVTVPAGVLTGRSDIEKFNGVGYLITLTFQAGSETIRAYKRITVFSGSGRVANTNPDISSLGLTTLPTVETSILPTLSLGTTTYQLMNQSGVVTNIDKKYFISYFVTDGTLKKSRTDVGEAALWTPPVTAPSGRPATVVGVIYDSIGGMDFVIVNL